MTQNLTCFKTQSPMGIATETSPAFYAEDKKKLLIPTWISDGL
jgi:hypothetical protein